MYVCTYIQYEVQYEEQYQVYNGDLHTPYRKRYSHIRIQIQSIQYQPHQSTTRAALKIHGKSSLVDPPACSYKLIAVSSSQLKPHTVALGILPFRVVANDRLKSDKSRRSHPGIWPGTAAFNVAIRHFE